ncbi:hypothetical protein [Clostridium sp. HBUAS56010]|uniref:hypothetical protein n=1 Tax=Clostridium sp. HBUAS56010 TaxID=2571127 RepID=UPI001177359A|nr:hypothetical protein [Clostridium sp. HBUAS56010]
MYKITNVTDRNGNVKHDAIKEIIELCPDMTGEILYPEFMKPGNRFCFLWNGDSGRMMRTSLIEDIEEDGNVLHVTTMNTEYWLEKVEA